MYSSNRIQNFNQNNAFTNKQLSQSNQSFQGNGFSTHLNYNNNMNSNGNQNFQSISPITLQSGQQQQQPGIYSFSSLLGPVPVITNQTASNGSSISSLMSSNNSNNNNFRTNSSPSPLGNSLMGNGNNNNRILNQDLFASLINADLPLDQTFMNSNNINGVSNGVSNGNSLLGTPLSNQVNNNFNMQQHRHNNIFNKNSMVNNKKLTKSLLSSTNNKKIHLQTNEDNNRQTSVKVTSETMANAKCGNLSHLQKAMEANKRNINQTTSPKTDSIESVNGNNLKRCHSSSIEISIESSSSDKSDISQVDTLLNQQEINKKVCTTIYIDDTAQQEQTSINESNSNKPSVCPRVDSYIIAVDGLLSSINQNEHNFQVKVNAFYCKVCSLVLNDESAVKQHLYTVLHRNKVSSLLKTTQNIV